MTNSPYLLADDPGEEEVAEERTNSYLVRFDKSKYFNLANTSYLGSTAHQLMVAEERTNSYLVRSSCILHLTRSVGTRTTHFKSPPKEPDKNTLIAVLVLSPLLKFT